MGMLKQWRTGSCRGIPLNGVTRGEVVLAIVLGIISALVLIIAANVGGA